MKMSHFWYARLENENQYAIGTGDREIAIVTGPNPVTARDWAGQMAASLNQLEEEGSVQ